MEFKTQNQEELPVYPSADKYYQSGDPEQDVVTLREIVFTLKNNKLWIFAAIILSIFLAFLLSELKAPQYRADGLIQIEISQNGFEKLESLNEILGGNADVSAEKEILSSRMILEKVVKNEKLDIIANPHYFPLIGRYISRNYTGDNLNSPILSLTSYAWGGEVISVNFLEVPPEYLDLPLWLTAGENSTFTITDDDSKILLKASQGEPSSNGGFSIFVERLHARPGTRFRLVKLTLESAVKNLRDNLSIDERGKQSGVLELSLTGPDRARIKETLDELLGTYLRLNIDRRSAQAEQTLEFLETQLVALKKQVGNAENAYNNYRQSQGSVDLNLETQGILSSLIDIENATLKLNQEREELRQRFTNNHPTILALDAKLSKLSDRRKQIESTISQLPDTQKEVLRLARDMEVSTQLYTSLLLTAQQLKVSKAGTIGNIRIIDKAAASKRPIGIKPIFVLAISALIGLIGGVISVFLRSSLRVVVDDPETIESQLGVPVYATIPHSKAEVSLSRKQTKFSQEIRLLAANSPDDDAVESLRGLRTSLHFALLDAAHNSVLITGSQPKLGKSFLTNNLGVVLSHLGKRIVIVDADLRRGSINTQFGLTREVGVSEYITGQASIQQVVKPTAIPNLYVVTSGCLPPNPSELLMHTRFETLLSELKNRYDTLIIDSPPILAVSDAIIISRLVGATFIVARAGKQSLVELEQTVKCLNQVGVSIKGFILNDFKPKNLRSHYGQKGYVYNYSYK